MLKVSRTGETGENLIELTLADGSTVRAHNVLVCGGSFCSQLLPAELALPLHAYISKLRLWALMA